MSLEKTDPPVPSEYKEKAPLSEEPTEKGQVLDSQGRSIDPEKRYKKLSWQRLTICLIVAAIALGALSIPAAFASLGMIAGVIVTVGIGMIAIYTSYVCGQVYILNPWLKDYASAVGLIGGRTGYWIAAVMFCLCMLIYHDILR